MKQTTKAFKSSVLKDFYLCGIFVTQRFDWQSFPLFAELSL